MQTSECVLTTNYLRRLLYVLFLKILRDQIISMSLAGAEGVKEAERKTKECKGIYENAHPAWFEKG